jgi:hypothetical protein
MGNLPVFNKIPHYNQYDSEEIFALGEKCKNYCRNGKNEKGSWLGDLSLFEYIRSKDQMPLMIQTR